MASSTKPPIPPDLLQKGRPQDDCFLRDESLYIRIDKVDILGGKITPHYSCLHPPSQSVNRGKYSKPEWVLLARYPKYLTSGYGVLLMGDIPAPIQSSVSDTKHKFRIRHVPLPDNYAHSEIWSYSYEESEKRVKGKNKTIDTMFRFKLSQAIEVLQLPSG